MYMESGGECIFYKVIDMSTLTSGTSAALTFIQAMSCVEANNANTEPYKRLMFQKCEIQQ